MPKPPYSPTCEKRTDDGLCGRESVRDVGTVSMCQDHVDELFGQLWDSLSKRGVGRRVVGPDGVCGWPPVECVSCGATWCGWDGEACRWCEERHKRMRRDQRIMLLVDQRPNVEAMPDANELEAWAQRLHVGVESELITAEEARRALAPFA